jgi:hypothetical protein
MLILGTMNRFQQDEVELLETVGYENTQRIKELIQGLDENYGDNRDIFKNDGGYVAVISNEEDWKDFDSLSEGLLTRNNYETYEYYDVGYNFYEIAYVLNNETVATVFMPCDLFHE